MLGFRTVHGDAASRRAARVRQAVASAGRHILLAVPTATTKGVLGEPTVFGNVLLGPTAEDIADKGDTSSTRAGIDHLLARGRAHPARPRAARRHGGLRRASCRDGARRLPGVRSCARGIRLRRRDPLDRAHRVDGDRGARTSRSWKLEVFGSSRSSGPRVRMPQIGERSVRPYARQDLISRDPEYGRVVCFCERVTRERSAMRCRRRCRPSIWTVCVDGRGALMGRCQGFFCGAAVSAMLPRRRCPRRSPAGHR